MAHLASKNGNGCFWLGLDNGKYLVNVEDGITLDGEAHPVAFATARSAYDACLNQYEQADGMERHAYWNVCSALEEYVWAEENGEA